MSLPSTLTEPPHSTSTRDLSEYHIDHGRLVQGKQRKKGGYPR
jgi:hypothetical protein